VNIIFANTISLSITRTCKCVDLISLDFVQYMIMRVNVQIKQLIVNRAKLSLQGTSIFY